LIVLRKFRFPEKLFLREAGALIDFTVKKGDSNLSPGLRSPLDLISISRKMHLPEILH
jgi:hypothetical protein